MIDETYIIERFVKFVVISNVMISKQIYDEKIAKFFIDLIFQILFQNFLSSRFEKNLLFLTKITNIK